MDSRQVPRWLTPNVLVVEVASDDLDRAHPSRSDVVRTSLAPSTGVEVGQQTKEGRHEANQQDATYQCYGDGRIRCPRRVLA
jgi:hypothetical protein